MKISSVLLGFIPDTLIAYIIMKVLDGQGWKFFILTFLALQSFYFVRWIFQSIVGWIDYGMHKSETINEIYVAFRDNNFPNPEEYNDGFKDISPERYFGNVSNNDKLEAKTRLMARAASAEIGMLRSLGLAQPLLRLIHIQEQGIKKYQDYWNNLKLGN